MLLKGAAEMVQWLRAPVAVRDPGFGSQKPYSGSQLGATPVSGDLTLSFALYIHRTAYATIQGLE